MKKKILKVLALVACAVLLVVGSIAGTLAYMTSLTGTVTNTFTVGNVEITLDEAVVDEYGVRTSGRTDEGNDYKLIPGHNYVKDPTIHVADGSEECWLFVKIENGISDIEIAEDDGAVGYETIAEQLEANGWTLVDDETNVYAYNVKATAGADVVVFSSFTIDGNKDVATYTSAQVTVTAYAVQADGFDTAAEAWDDAPTTWTKAQG